MYNGISHFLWLTLGFLILICELYVPYKIRVFLSICMSAFVVCFLSFFLTDIFTESVLFIIASAFFYCTSYIVSLFQKKREVVFDTISLDDINEASYGRVYCNGKTYVIKNDSGKFIKKGEVVKLEKNRLEGESLVV
ncbi:MAG: hypothetical protein E7621_03125 [Ruminococcaceae bacterium]|nr:hypothetical protein [Oscillospiraceae bacterium]